MLTKTQMQQIQELKLIGYTKTDIIRYYEARGAKPPSRLTISKYYDMDVVPDDPDEKLAVFCQVLFLKKSVGIPLLSRGRIPR